jgi:hypothetical protein
MTTLANKSTPTKHLFHRRANTSRPQAWPLADIREHRRSKQASWPLSAVANTDPEGSVTNAVAGRTINGLGSASEARTTVGVRRGDGDKRRLTLRCGRLRISSVRRHALGTIEDAGSRELE